MSHTVNLTKTHKKILLTCLDESHTIKYNKLRNPESRDKMTQLYNSVGAKLLEPVVCGRIGTKVSDNVFGWYIDQINHSGNLAESEFGKYAIEICRAAGTNQYDKFCSITIISKLFEI